MINIKMQPTEVQKLSPKIMVIGVGGAGGNAVNNMISSNLDGCEFIVCNTDAQALENSLCGNRIQLGVHVTGGLGAGSKPEIGKAAAEENIEEVMQYIDGANMVFITAGMGGGSGSGASPVIAKACRERGILTVGVVTKPFHFEGTHRMRVAENAIEEMQQYVDTLIIIPNQNLFRVANEKTTFAEGFRMADSVLQSGVRGVTDLMVRPGLVNLDFADIRTAMMEMGKAMMGTGEASGEKRAIEAAEAAINNPLLDDVSMKGAHGVIINVTGGYDMTLFEVDEACNRIRDEVDPNANIIFGATFDENLEGIMRVSIVATGIEKESHQRRKGGGGFSTDARSKAQLERARPNTEAQPQQQEMPVTASAPVAAQSQPQPQQLSMPPLMAAPGGYAGRYNMRGITAPVSPAVEMRQDVMVERAPDPEADMFEQREFTAFEPSGQQRVGGIPHNTALRGSRYKDSFIPPKPVMPEAEMTQTQSVVGNLQAGPPVFQRRPGSESSTAPALKLNPPRVPERQLPKRSPSLFERITGSVQQRIENVMGDYEEDAAPRQRTMPPAAPTPGQPAQGRLNISAPAAKPKPQASEDELDIPAFLRRQAN